MSFTTTICWYSSLNIADFRIAEGPDVETDDYNFTKLNIPPEHPARQMHDTFYLPPAEDGTPRVLRTHTSPVQIRAMMASPPPHRIIALGLRWKPERTG